MGSHTSEVVFTALLTVSGEADDAAVALSIRSGKRVFVQSLTLPQEVGYGMGALHVGPGGGERLPCSRDTGGGFPRLWC